MKERKYATDEMITQFLHNKGWDEVSMNSHSLKDRNGSCGTFEVEDYRFKIHFIYRRKKYGQKDNANCSYQFMDFVSTKLILDQDPKAVDYLAGAIAVMDKEIEERQKALEIPGTTEEMMVKRCQLRQSETVKNLLQEKYNTLVPSSETQMGEE